MMVRKKINLSLHACPFLSLYNTFSTIFGDFPPNFELFGPHTWKRCTRHKQHGWDEHRVSPIEFSRGNIAHISPTHVRRAMVTTVSCTTTWKPSYVLLNPLFFLISPDIFSFLDFAHLLQLEPWTSSLSFTLSFAAVSRSCSSSVFPLSFSPSYPTIDIKLHKEREREREREREGNTLWGLFSL